MAVIYCAWCDQPATVEVEIAPAGTTTIPTPQGRRAVLKPSKRVPACYMHSTPDERTGPPRSSGPIEGQLSIYDALGDEAA